MHCGKELDVNACMRAEIRLLCIYRLKARTPAWHDQFLWTQQKPNDAIYNGDMSWFDSLHCNNAK